MIRQIVLRAFGQSKIFSGAFGASQFRPKNGFGASNNSGSPAGGGGGWTYGGRPGQRVEEQGTWAAQKHSEAGNGRPVDRGVWTAKTVKRPRQQPAHPQYANYWAPLTRKRHTMPHSAQPQHTNDWAPRTRKRHRQEHRPQRPRERSDPTQHAKGRTGDCPGPRKGATTRRNVTQGGVPPTAPPPPPLRTPPPRAEPGQTSCPTGPSRSSLRPPALSEGGQRLVISNVPVGKFRPEKRFFGRRDAPQMSCLGGIAAFPLLVPKAVLLLQRCPLDIRPPAGGDEGVGTLGWRAPRGTSVPPHEQQHCGPTDRHSNAAPAPAPAPALLPADQ